MNDIIQSKPFEGVDSEYMAINDVLDRDIQILDFKTFENDKGEGVFILCKDAEFGQQFNKAIFRDDGHDMFHICTHSVGVVGTMQNPKVREVLDTGDIIATRIVQRKSTKSDRMVYSFA